MSKKQTVNTKKLFSIMGLVLLVGAALLFVMAVNGKLPISYLLKTRATGVVSGWVEYRADGFESGTFSGWDQTNASEGTLTIIEGASSTAGVSEGSKIAMLTQNGSSSTNGHFSRTIWNLPSWGEGQIYRTEASFYLPADFYPNMMGAVQLIGWDTYPTLQNQMRLVIFNSDRLARLFVKEDGNDRQLTGTFSIPSGQWLRIVIEQKLSQTGGWSNVYMNGNLVAAGSGTNCPTNASICNDTLTAYPVTRLRYGLVAIADIVQSKPLTLYMDDVKLAVGSEITGTPTTTATPTPTPTVGDTTPPAVEITQPINGATVLKGQNVIVSATATDNIGVESVAFMINGSNLCTDTIAPSSCNRKVPKGKARNYNITAIAKDRAGNNSSSQIEVIAK